MSAAGVHSLGPTCAYYEEEPDEFQTESSDPPKVRAQFFYVSSLPIDDPLSPLPAIPSDKSLANQSPQPFSARDNAALEEAWQGLQKGEDPAQNDRPKSKPKLSRKMYSFPKFKGGHRSPSPGGLPPTVERSGEYFAEQNEMTPGTFAPQESYQKLKQPPPETPGQIAKPEDPMLKEIPTNPTGDNSILESEELESKKDKPYFRRTDSKTNNDRSKPEQKDPKLKVDSLESGKDDRKPRAGTSKSEQNDPKPRADTSKTEKNVSKAHVDDSKSKKDDMKSSNTANLRSDEVKPMMENSDSVMNIFNTNGNEAKEDKSRPKPEKLKSQKDESKYMKDGGPKPEKEDLKASVNKSKTKKQDMEIMAADSIPEGRESSQRQNESMTSARNSNKPVKLSQQSKEPPVMLSQGSEHVTDSSEPITAKELCPEDVDLEKKSNNKRRFSPFRRKEKPEPNSRGTSPELTSISAVTEGVRSAIQTGVSLESDISGRPFARAPSKRDITGRTIDGADDTSYRSDDSEEQSSRSRSRLHNAIHPYHKYEKTEKKVYVPVGVSRLHLVEMPDLVMKPIYWQAMNDQSSVTRATWFFKESMLPVPAEVANLLEVGYENLRPSSPTYQDELNACVENGPSAEFKIVHKLWPSDMKNSMPATVIDTSVESERIDGYEASSNIAPEAQENAAADSRQLKAQSLFETCSVIYVDGKDAQILKPNQLPSEARGRKPLGAIRKGRQIGVAVVRGFDRKMWRKLHPDPKMDAKAAHAAIGAYMSQSGDATTRGRRMSCSACGDEKKPLVTDLVLVIHGIGQKLSERVDSFHFTHAINGLRRDLNIELASEAVKGNLRADTGIMVLPVNWRLTVSFEDEPKEFGQSPQNSYHLTDITPDTLQGIRSLISDVMLDIPYYLSHHRQKMTSAVIKEANRVYRLWCRNNPGFQDHGRVHLVAHSLGSAMAMDILSQQPTTVKRKLDLSHSKVSDISFEFNTTNLFCCGSPSGFFLLLNGANLIPRKGREKPGMDGQDEGPGIAGEAGTYGCLAVDNVYNIAHRNDPVAYMLNACVDRSYASSLVPATIPTATPSLFSRVGNSLRLTSASAGYGTPTAPQRPTMASMPSTVEMETHNFTQEEIAEKKMYLLNENGQIDYFLNSGGGPLEIQYLSMLSAHSSYWVLQDFVRFLVVEIGRTPGKDGTLPALRAQKKRELKKATIA